MPTLVQRCCWALVWLLNAVPTSVAPSARLPAYPHPGQTYLSYNDIYISRATLQALLWRAVRHFTGQAFYNTLVFDDGRRCAEQMKDADEYADIPTFFWDATPPLSRCGVVYRLFIPPSSMSLRLLSRLSLRYPRTVLLLFLPHLYHLDDLQTRACPCCSVPVVELYLYPYLVCDGSVRMT